MDNIKPVENALSGLLQGFQRYNRKNTFGNQILYDMCEPNKNPWGEPNRLADKIWLIGRSYAASPERRYYRKKNENGAGEERAELETRGDGTGKDFQGTAAFLCNDGHYPKLTACLKELSPLRFDGTPEDIERLKQGIMCVALFNEMFKAASEQYDQEHNAGIYESLVYRNQISFCSKFLHFHVPHSIFIIDRFTKEGGRILCSTRIQKNARMEDCDAVIDKAAREMVSAYNPQIKISLKDIGVEVDDRSEKSVKDYIDHCLRSYIFGCFLKKKLNLSLDEMACSFPRMIDSIFQRVKQA